jgi:hypothetical protein
LDPSRKPINGCATGRRATPPGCRPRSRVSSGFAFGASVTVNLAAERDLMETMTLSFIVPFALGWFWFANAMARSQRVWGL